MNFLLTSDLFFFFFIPEIQENKLNTLHSTPHDDRLVNRSRCFPGYICVYSAVFVQMVWSWM